jgi:hypothetical protein
MIACQIKQLLGKFDKIFLANLASSGGTAFAPFRDRKADSHIFYFLRLFGHLRRFGAIVLSKLIGVEGVDNFSFFFGANPIHI